MENIKQKLPLSPFTLEKAEDTWNIQDPERISKAYTIKTEFINGRERSGSFFEKNGLLMKKTEN